MKLLNAKSLALMFLVLGLALLVAGCGADYKSAGPSGQARMPAPLAVQTAPVARVLLDDIYEAPGTVRPRNSAVISSKVLGYVQEVRVQPGDPVRAGQVLVVLAAQDLEAQVARATAAGLAAQNAVVEAEKARTAAQSAAQLAATTLQRYQTLLGKRSISQQEFDEAEARARTAAANQEMAAAAIARARAGQRQAEAELEAARVMRGYATLTAPFDGVVSEKRLDPGSLAMPGQPLLVVEQAGDFRLEATVEESRIGAIKLADRVQVSIDALGAGIEGGVSEIVPAVDAASRTFLVKVDLPRLPGTAEVRSGMFGRAGFRQGQRQVMAVPDSAVLRFGQLQSVYVAENGVARQRLVTLGAKSGNRVEVLSGLNEGERLVLSNVAGLRDGARLEEAKP